MSEDPILSNPPALPVGLYIVATPLGHARDITLRALDVLRTADLIFCEDTRVTSKLMKIYGLKATLRACHEHNESHIAEEAIVRLSQGRAVVLVSDAGTPLISDPGFRMVKSVRDAGYNVFPVPGASSPIAALSVSGLPSDRFTFMGFLPSKMIARRKALAALAPDMGTLILFESPRRLPALLLDLNERFGDCPTVVAREMTKKFEEIRHGTPLELAEYFSQKEVKGECVVLISLARAVEAAPEDIEYALKQAMEKMSLRDAAQFIADSFELPRKQIYALAIKLQD
jgi:16S rRNA (cytidine1402-2'-O)-methyltransferase